MSIVTDAATLVTAIGGLSGLTQVVLTAVRPQKQRMPALSTLPAPLRPPTALPTAAQRTRAHSAALLATCSLILGGCAWLLAVAAIVIIGKTAVSLGAAPLRSLEVALIFLAALAIGTCIWSFSDSQASGLPGSHRFRAAAGLVIAIGALGTLIAVGPA